MSHFTSPGTMQTNQQYPSKDAHDINHVIEENPANSGLGFSRAYLRSSQPNAIPHSFAYTLLLFFLSCTPHFRRRHTRKAPCKRESG